MSAPETEARHALIEALKEAFSAEKFPVHSERMHTSRGQNQTEIAVYPERTHHGKDALLSEMFLGVQFFGAWDKQINVEQSADPTVIEANLERFREKLKSGIDPRTPHVWYFMLERTDFLTDPVGGITRFEAHICARGNNTALLETK